MRNKELIAKFAGLCAFILIGFNAIHLSATQISKDSTTITLLVVYTEDAAQWAEQNQSGINNVIAQGIAYTNLAFENSGLQVEIELVYSQMVDYDESGTVQTDLNRLRARGDGYPFGPDYAGYLEEVHTLRDEHSADLVKLVTLTGGSAGRGITPSRPDPATGFSVTRVEFATTLTFAHEIGHNLGFHHSRTQNLSPAPPQGGIFEYSTGWQWTGNDEGMYVSVMTYRGNPPALRVPYFSNPDVLHQGQPTGSYSGAGAPADNARSLREVKNYISGYRGSAYEPDSLAMISFYENLGGTQWHDKSNWLTNHPLRNWYGIESLAWRVFELNFSQNNLSGVLPSDFGQLQELRTIRLRQNNIRGPIPNSLADLQNLLTIDLSENDLSGKIPAIFGELKDLRELTLNKNDFSGGIPSYLFGLDNLYILNLSDNDLSGDIPDNIKESGDLRILGFSSNNLTGRIPDELFKLDFLNSLYLDNNKISGPIPRNINRLENLSQLFLNDNKLTGILPEELGALNNLNSLIVSNNELRGELPASMVNLQMLRRFIFDGNYICIPSDPELESWLDNLEILISTEVKCDDVQTDPVTDLFAPLHHSELTSEKVTFEWEPVVENKHYQLQISLNDNFTNIFFDEKEITENTLTLNDLVEGEDYYWRVRTHNNYLDSEWSDTKMFSITGEAISSTRLNLDFDDGIIILNWQPVESDRIDSYVLYRGESMTSLERYAVIEMDQLQFMEKHNEGSKFYAVSSTYKRGGETVLSNPVGVVEHRVTINPGWKLISSPVSDSEFFTNQTQLFMFSNIYERSTSIKPGRGYWARSSSGEDLTFLGIGITEKSFVLQKGWNLIGSLAGTISKESISDPQEILPHTAMYSYSNGSYRTVNELQPGEGYWVFAENEGTIFMSADSTRIKPIEHKKPISTDIFRLVFSSNSGEQDLWITEGQLTDSHKLHFLMPPKAPSPGLDVRTSQEYKISDLATREISIVSKDYPVSVKLSSNTVADNNNIRIVASDGPTEHFYDLSNKEPALIDREYQSYRFVLEGDDEFVSEFNVSPNYPNPFNPSTAIQYQIPEQSYVVAEVYNIIGQKVATLLNETQQPGFYTIEFDGSNHATGVYIVRIQAGDLAKVQKITLIK